MNITSEVMPELKPAKVELVVAQAESRNKRIPTFKNHIPHNRTLDATLFARATGLWFLPNVYVEGTENIDQIREILASGGKVIGASSHKTDGDTIGIQEALNRSGYPDLARITGFPAGLKMWERSYIRPYVESIYAFPVLTPADEENIENLFQNKERYGLEQKQVEAVEKYKENGRALTKWSGIAMRRFTRAGNWLIVYVETTRSRTNSQLQPARDEALEYFRMDDLWVAPIEVHGIEKINPPEEPFHWFERTDAFVTFGKLFKASWLQECQLPETLLGRNVRRADLLSLEIAILNREMVDPSDMEYYDALHEYVASQALAS